MYQLKINNQFINFKNLEDCKEYAQKNCIKSIYKDNKRLHFKLFNIYYTLYVYNESNNDFIYYYEFENISDISKYLNVDYNTFKCKIITSIDGFDTSNLINTYIDNILYKMAIIKELA